MRYVCVGAPRWLTALLVAMVGVFALVLGVAGAVPASAATTAYTYDTAAHTYDAPALLSSLNAAAAGARGSSAGPGATGIAAKGAASAGDHIALGLKAQGLEATAAKVGGRTLLKDPEWMATLQKAVGDPSTKFTVSVDGLSGSSTYSQVMSAAQRGAAGTGGYTDWELAQLYQAGTACRTTSVSGGSAIPNPFAP